MTTAVNTNTAAVGATNVNVATEAISGDVLQRIKIATGDLGVDGGDVGSLASGTGKPGMLTAAGATEFYFSTVNSSTAQLASGATFTGTIETIVNAQAISMGLTSDQPGTLTLNQYVDAGGTRLLSSWPFAVAANVPFSRCFTANGNYFNLTFANSGGSTTTTLNINAAFGTLPAVTNLGYAPVSLNEIGGTLLTAGQKTAAASIPVVLASDSSQDTAASGSLVFGGNNTVQISTVGKGTAAFTVTGTWAGTIVVELFDGTNWNATSYVALTSGNAANQFTANTSGQVNAVGYQACRLRGASLSSGTANVIFSASEKVATIMLDNGLPTGSNNIGSINNVTGTVTGIPTSLGQKTRANSTSVSMASDQPAQYVRSCRVLASATNNLIATTGTVQFSIVPGGNYNLCVSIASATLGATANTLASCTTTLNSTTVAYTGTAPQVGQLVAGTGISPGSYVVSVNAGVSFVISLPASAGGTNTLNVTAGAFAGNFEVSADGSTWNSATVIPKTYNIASASTSTFVAPGLFKYFSGANDNFIRFNVTSINATGVAGNLSANPTLRFDVDEVNTVGGNVHLPYISYIAATAATFPTGIPVVMPFDTEYLSDITVDLSAFAGTSQTITWRQSNDPTGIGFQGVSHVTTHLAQNTAAITANAAGNYKIAPSSQFFYAAMTGGTAVTSMTIGGVVGRVNSQPAVHTVHISTNNTPVNISQVGGTTTVNGGLAGTLAIGGAAAHSAATTTNPATVGGRVIPTTAATVDATLVAGDASFLPITTGYQAAVKPYGTAELDWAAVSSLTPTVWASSATLTQVRAASGTANVRTYVSGLSISADALSAITSLWLVDGAVAISSSTVATPGVITSGTHDFKVGDAIVLQGITSLALTGVSANQVIYVATVPSTTTFTVALTPGGTGVQCTVTGTATAYRILHQVRLQATTLPFTTVTLPSPIRTAPNVALSLLCSATTTGTVFANTQGYYGF